VGEFDVRVFLRCFVLLGALVCVCGVLAPAPVSAHPRRTPRPRHARHLYPTLADARSQRAEPNEFAGGEFTAAGPPLTYQGGNDGIGITPGQPTVYLVFWGSQWGANLANDPAGVAPRLQALLAGIGTDDESWSGVMTQYCEGVPVGTEVCPADSVHVGYPTGGALAGVWNDTAVAAPTNASASDIANEAIAAAAHFGNTTAVSNRSAQYVVASATGMHPDGFAAGAPFCAWHDFTSPPTYSDIAFTNLPYIPDMGPDCGANFVNAGAAGALDGVTMVEGHEYAETITDQNPEGGWADENGQETADKCAWLSSGEGRAQNVDFATGSFAMQGTWSNDGQHCLISHAIRGVPGLPDDFQLALSNRSTFSQPGDDGTTQLTSVTVAGNPQSLALSASGIPAGMTVSFGPSAMDSEGASAVTVATSATTPKGQYPITITATGSVVHSVTLVVVVGPEPPTLQNGVPVTGLSGAAGSDEYWQIDVPPDLSQTDFTIWGGTGDADLYIAQDVPPTDADFGCSSVTPGNLETCHVYGIRDHWFVRVHGTAAFSGLSLQVTSASPQLLYNGLTFSGISGSAGSQQFFWVNVGPNARIVKVSIGGFHGDADLYGRPFGFPNPSVDVCKPPKVGRRSETCTIRTPAQGYWYFSVYARTDYSTLKVKVRTR
jgi:serine protease